MVFDRCRPASRGPGRGSVIRESGRLEAGASTVLRSQAPSARAILTIVPEGQTVAKGDVLVELDDLQLSEEKGLADARGFEARAQVEATETALPAREKESAMAVEIAEQVLAQAQSEVRLAQERLAMASECRMETEQRLANDPNKRSLQEARLAESQAQMRSQVAEAELRKLSGFVHEQRRAELRLAVAQRKLDLERARNQQAEVTQRAKAEIAIAKVRLAYEQNRASRLEAQIMASKIYAPHAGIVRYERATSGRGPGSISIGPGTQVCCHEPLVRVESMDHPKLTVRTTVDVARRVEPGRTATICFDALPQRTFQGHVTDVRMLPGPATGSAGGLITVQIDNPTDALRLGMSARVEIEP
jgi:multidrug efflux pump subunit AcrA (membrane-fusion protein)